MASAPLCRVWTYPHYPPVSPLSAPTDLEQLGERPSLAEAHDQAEKPVLGVPIPPEEVDEVGVAACGLHDLDLVHHLHREAGVEIKRDLGLEQRGLVAALISQGSAPHLGGHPSF